VKNVSSDAAELGDVLMPQNELTIHCDLVGLSLGKIK
jgi:hypothetical protein